MPHLRFGAALFVCASIYAQQTPSLQGVIHHRLESATVLALSAVAADANNTDAGTRHFNVAAIEPEAVSFTEFEDGRYVAVMSIDASSLRAARIHFQSLQLPEGAELYLYSERGRGEAPPFAVGPYTNVGPLDGSDFWSDALPGGQSIIVELQVRGEIPSALPFQIDLVEELESWGARNHVEPSAAEKPSAERRASIFRGEEIEHEVRDNEAIFEGDILLGDIVELQPATPGAGKDRSKSAIGQTSTYYRWPSGVIPYVITTAPLPASVTAAINHWNTLLAGVILLTPRTNQTDYVNFVSGTGCSSYIGRVGGAQAIKLSSACTVGNIIHEIGHAVGLYHEQSREDRNSWVRVNTANISSSSLSNFNQAPASTDDLIYYAYNSIMHYHATAFSANGLPTIETIPAGIPIGQRAGLDISDIAAVRKMYSKQTATVSVSTVPTGLTVTVDGLPVVTPASFNWPAGSVHTIGAPASIVQIAPSQYSFVRWTDGGAATHTITVPSTGLAVAATYALQHKLTTAVATTYTGSTAIAPAASTTLYGDGLKVAITATPASGYCFSGWTGLTAGTPNQTTVSMTRSYAPVAAFIPGAVTPAVTAASIPAAGGTFTMNTTATTGCGWGIKSSASWLTVSKTYATSASPSFSYTVQPNTTGVARTAYLTIHNRTVTITQ